MDDNPLVVIAERRMISNGNFHPIAMATRARRAPTGRSPTSAS